MKPYKRTERVADLIMRELAMTIKYKGSDPRFSGVTVTHVDVAPDFSNAKVYVTFIDAAEQKEGVAALNKAAGYFQKILSKNIEMRRIPRLIFHYDESILHGSKLSALINDVTFTPAENHENEDAANE